MFLKKLNSIPLSLDDFAFWEKGKKFNILDWNFVKLKWYLYKDIGLVETFTFPFFVNFPPPFQFHLCQPSPSFLSYLLPILPILFASHPLIPCYSHSCPSSNLSRPLCQLQSHPSHPICFQSFLPYYLPIIFAANPTYPICFLSFSFLSFILPVISGPIFSPSFYPICFPSLLSFFLPIHSFTLFASNSSYAIWLPFFLSYSIPILPFPFHSIFSFLFDSH